MFRSATLVCALLLVGGVRVVKERSTSKHALAAELGKGGTLKNNINSTLKALDTNGKNASKAGVDLMNEVAGIDWLGDVGSQMVKIVKKSGLVAAQWIASAAHPLLGVVFSLMSSLFGWGQAGSCNMVEEILEEVDRMIKGAIGALRLELLQETVDGVLAVIDNAGENEFLWKQLSTKLADQFGKVFVKNCWNNPGSGQCRTWRRGIGGGGGAAALILEMKFTELMILSVATLFKYGLTETLGSLVENTVTAAELTRGHYNVFQGWRLNFNSAESGVTKGNVTCGGRMNNKACSTNPSRDHLLDEDFCARSRVSCKRFKSATACKASVESQLNNCHSNYVRSIRNNLENNILPEIEALNTTAISLKRGKAKLRARKL